MGRSRLAHFALAALIAAILGSPALALPVAEATNYHEKPLRTQLELLSFGRMARLPALSRIKTTDDPDPDYVDQLKLLNFDEIKQILAGIAE